MLLSIFWDTLLPIFLIIATGFLLMRQFGVDVRALSLVAFYLFLPCLMFTNLLQLHLVLTAFAQICLVHVGMVTLLLVCVWMIAWLQAWERPRRNAFMMTSIMQNVGNYGLPISQLTFGADGLAMAVLYHALTTITGNTLGVVLSSAGSTPLRQAVKAPGKTPLLHAIVLALVCRASALPVPAPLLRSIELCAHASVPLLLLILGMQLAQLQISTERAPMAFATLLRLGVSPLFAVLLTSLLGMQGLLRSVSIIMWSVPTGIAAAALAVQYDCQPRFVAGAIFATTLVSFVTIPLLLLWVLP